MEKPIHQKNYADGDVSGSEIIDCLKNAKYPKPRWMLNKSVNDHEWIIAKVGMDLSNVINSKNSRKLSFKKRISPNEYLTDRANEPLLTDIINSILYLNITGNISRSERISDIFNAMIHLIRHANEIRVMQGKASIRSLEMIKFHDVESYLSSFNVEMQVFEQALTLVIEREYSLESIKWNEIKNKLQLSTREFASLKHKLGKYLKSRHNILNKASHYTAEYTNANSKDFDIEFDLSPSEKTISNEISKLESLYTSRTAQRYPFKHPVTEMLSDGSALFEQMTNSIKTSLIPVNIALHALSKALFFVRNYGPSIHELVKDLSISEKVSINTLGITPSQVVRNTSKIKSHAFNHTKISTSLSDLNITSWETEGSFENIKHDQLRKELSVGAVILLYVASMWIILASFTAGRKLSLTNLKRNCFQQSPIDGLFDIIMRIPKSSERFELEDTYRPIPDLIFDYGIEFASFVSSMEERQGYFFNEADVFLFGRILSLHSYDAFGHSNTDTNEDPVHKYALSGETIYKAICFFQDWTESPLINGKRWYPSNHQFRRLFAVLYFSFSDESGLEELSWFMGHSSLEQTFHYAEVNPSDEWIDEAEATIASIGASLRQTINADKTITNIIGDARQSSSIELVLEPLIRSMVDEHKLKTGQEIRFYKIDDKEVFFYFYTPGDT